MYGMSASLDARFLATIMRDANALAMECGVIRLRGIDPRLVTSTFHKLMAASKRFRLQSMMLGGGGWVAENLGA